MQAVKVRVLSRLPLFIMKVTVENKKGLEKDIKVFIDKKTISGYLDAKYEEIKKDTTSIYFGSCCVCQLSFNVKLEKGRKYKHKGYVNLFTLDKKTDEEIEIFDIDQKKRIMYMKYPIKREYELTEYKIKPNHIQNVLELDIEFNYFQYI